MKEQCADVHPEAEMKDKAQMSSLGLKHPLHYNMFKNKIETTPSVTVNTK